MIYIGVDPGKSGAIAFFNPGTKEVWTIKGDETLRDLHSELENAVIYESGRVFAMLEQVHAMPGQGVSSTFKFGQSYGQLEALLVCSGISFDRVTPAKWQTALSCRSKGDKNVTKAKAQELFPQVEKVTHATADALLLAEYCRRKHES